MKRLILLSLLLILLSLIAGCIQSKSFSYGLNQIELVNSRYNITFDSYPGNINQLSSAIGAYRELKNIKLDKDNEAFALFLDYQLLSLESDLQFVNSLKYGDYGTTKKGFGCKMRPLVIETAKFRNDSANLGFEAAGKLKEFIDLYPKKSKLVSLSQKNIVFLNASFYEMSKDADSDSSTINGSCPENLTLEIYKRQFKRDTNLSDEYINSLNYIQAVKLWKQIESIE